MKIQKLEGGDSPYACRIKSGDIKAKSEASADLIFWMYKLQHEGVEGRPPRAFFIYIPECKLLIPS